ncbi:hypothetical protein ACDW_24590 [Acidovorax sp. DW039]|uniref:hypothetical protein n=1 Tax=Acidovorax sp. DW039 TaxID=3095606 RepID=UPI00308FC186|nr:hypothetical protein ACDW_24590 [Acidovorax sp. DW039]
MNNVKAKPSTMPEPPITVEKRARTLRNGETLFSNQSITARFPCGSVPVCHAVALPALHSILAVKVGMDTVLQ